ncbi:hypothetical protein HBI56_013860 [Parastagonospora nodorum]|uniref:Uncharacterized protein n=1 Tax=Phaeosphaeria nodorum (strain SN15 / ATCC MYA-4574 / FGSC 10173) TaxID=321614 RepID=A0A7U2F1J0_PHANO|nr:hypothetical protein HBH56_086160 [Parastagonospora nodorum]QRC96953.1 hypothetical protein JI435_018260 [Parastagonospora nodorum SN15]KAH3921180.1 hypothetical protein HBH54_244570 [Parastagonospora nodorum]KAH3955671.1 hypothetical protein HBH53_008910 [Parastagonospora nodorum]KAH3956934.1 hypothetical protein HBH51_232630 [Parastagonospora nodorum]
MNVLVSLFRYHECYDGQAQWPMSFWIMVCLTLCFLFFNDACIYEVMTLDGIRWGFSAKLVGRIS